MGEARGIHVAAWLVGIGLLAGALSPAAGAHGPDPVIVYDFTAPGEVRGWSNVTLGPGPSQELLVDADGNGDEHVNATEAQALEDRLAALSQDEEASTFWDGATPSSASVTELEVTNAVGTIGSEDRLHIHSSSTLAYPEDAGSTHVWERETSGVDHVRHLKIKAPPGYEIAEHEGIQAAEGDTDHLEGLMIVQEDVAVTFSSEETAPVPLELTSLVLSALLAVGLCRRVD